MFTTVKYKHWPSFIPTDVNGLQFWFKADGIQTTDGTLLDRWTDFSPRNAHATASNNSFRPTYKTNIINGKPVVRFNAASTTHFLITSASFTGSTVFVVGNPSGSAAFISWPPIVMHSGSQSDYQANGLLYQMPTDMSGSVVQFYYNGGAYTNTSNTAFTSSQLITSYNERVDDTHTNASYRKNGTSIMSVSNVAIVPSINPLEGAIGARMQPGVSATYLTGDIAELIVYNTYIGDANRDKIETYLKEKYALY